MIDSLAPVVDTVPGDISAIPTLTLMRLGRDEHIYTWEVIQQS